MDIEQQLRRMGIPPTPERIEEVRRQLNPTLASGSEAQAERAVAVREKEEQAAVIKRLREAGCRVYSLSQPRATKQSPGLPDLFVFAPNVGAAFWFEVKRRQGGVQSEFQRDFQHLCAGCGVRFIIGGRREADRLLEQLGLQRSASGRE